MVSIVIFVLQVCAFGGIALYLHYRSENYGIAPLLFYMAGIMGILNFIELLGLNVELAPGIVIRPGGHVFVPLVLLVILILYVSSGTRAARIAITGLVGEHILILAVLMFLLLYLNVRDESTAVHGLFAEADILTPLFLRGVFASVIAFAANMVVIIVTYQGIKNSFPTFPEFFIPGIALLIALWVDAILYNILAFLGTPLFVPGIPGDVIMKTMAGLLLSPLAGWYLTNVAPRLTNFQGAADRPMLSIVFGEDRYGRRMQRLESELQVSRATYEQIMQHIEEVFWLLDVERQRLVYLSPNFEQITGRSPESFYRNPTALADLLPPEERGGDVLQNLFLLPDTEFRIVHTDGSIRWMRNRSFPISTPDQQIIRYAGIAEDVTVRREAQAQAFALELSSEKVKLLQRFVRDASHDLRAPLSSIMLKLELIPKASAERQEQILGDLRRVAEHLNALIDDLFTLSNLEGEAQIELKSVDFSEVVRQTCDDYRPLAQKNNLNLTLEISPRPVAVLGSREQLFRLVGNLIGNAINYTPQGNVTVRMDVQGAKAVLEVVDTGIGIPADQLNSVFERFFRTNEARSLRREGTGLGLAISKAIVEQHHGTITVQSAAGKGATFRVTLPLEQEQPA